MNRIFTSAVSLLFMIQCASQKNKPETKMPQTSLPSVNATYPQKAPEKGILRLSEGENVFLEQEKMNITFTKVLQDSRCPMDVNCVVAGDALLQIEVMGVQTRPRTFEISQDPKDQKNSFVFNGIRFSLYGIYPGRSVDLKPDELKGKYVIDLKMEATRK